ncbi:hypothetical protein A4X06_0g7430 [Tilletia controversa]|uniref:Uncharacterized protein n=1 Tax=Tilletia controversa TaxID=13291 RepID=A0A8X7MMU1_9BASI|nr:hypothetical protein CF328_g7491 [Tilletia controversa]KAE8241709.1 hypothetical protein A4X06_0g7430 [Tilletia controversa]
MSLFTRKFTGKNRSRSATENQITAPTASKSKDNGRAEYEFATLKASGQSKTTFRPVQHSTIAELDSFFGGTSSKKEVSDAANRFKDPSTGKVWYDSVDYQEWKTLLHSNSPGTPPSRRSSSTSLLATPNGATSGPARSRGAQSPLARATVGLGLGSAAEAVDGGGALSPLSEIISCYDYSPFVGASFGGSPRTPNMEGGQQRHQRSRSNSRIALPLLQSTVAGGVFTPSKEEFAPVMLDLGSTSPFSEQDRQSHVDSFGSKMTAASQSQSSRSLRAALGMADKRVVSASSTTRSTSNPSQSASKRLSVSFFSVASLSKPKSSDPPVDDPCKETIQDQSNIPPPSTLRSPLPIPDLPDASDANKTTSMARDHDSPQMMMMLNSYATTLLIQPVPSRAERTSRSARQQRNRAAKQKMLRRSSSADMIGSKSGSTSGSREEKESSSSIQENVIAKASLALQRLEIDEGRAASALSHASGSSLVSSESVSQPPAMIRLPPVLPLLQRRFERLHQGKEGGDGRTVGDARICPATAGSL